MNEQQRAVVQQALEALEFCQAPIFRPDRSKREEAITALRQLLEQPEPVQDGWILVPVTPTNDMTSAMADALEDPENERSSWDLAENMWHAMLPKVPTPPAQPEPVQEPQAFLHWYDNAHWGNEDFKEGCHRSWNAAIEHTTPPAQPAAWVGLTDEEIAEAGQLTVEGPRMLPYAFARAIEAKLKEKNT
jgi:hypothetical protein